jgi:hypothetical protein
MSKPYKVTPWFNPLTDGNPTRDGIYQRYYLNGMIAFCKYQDNHWYYGYDIKRHNAYTMAGRERMVSFVSYKHWRGVIYV